MPACVIDRRRRVCPATVEDPRRVRGAGGELGVAHLRKAGAGAARGQGREHHRDGVSEHEGDAPLQESRHRSGSDSIQFRSGVSQRHARALHAEGGRGAHADDHLGGSLRFPAEEPRGNGGLHGGHHPRGALVPRSGESQGGGGDRGAGQQATGGRLRQMALHQGRPERRLLPRPGHEAGSQGAAGEHRPAARARPPEGDDRRGEARRTRHHPGGGQKVEMRPQMTGAEALLRGLAAMGVERIFASPGSDWAPLWEALAAPWASGEAPAYISSRHEETAVGMATGYAKATGKLPALVVHTTVGALHATMGLRAALHERIPMVVMAGESIAFAEPPAPPAGRQWLRVLTDLGGPARLVEPTVKWSFGLNSSVILPHTIQRACQLAMSAPKGPVFVSVPTEMLMESMSAEPPPVAALPAAPVANEEAIAEVAAAL